MKMSSPPTYEEAKSMADPDIQLQPVKSNEDADILRVEVVTDADAEVPIPKEEPKLRISLSQSGLSSAAAVSVSLSQSQLPQPEEQRVRMRKPWFLWIISLIDIILGGYFVGVMFLENKTEKEFMRDSIFAGKPMLTEFVMMIVALRNLVQLLMGVTLFWGLVTTHESTTIRCLQGWIQCAYFILCELCFSMCSNITSLSTSDFDETTAWSNVGKVVGNSIDILFRALAFFIVRHFLNNLKSANSYASPGQRLRNMLRQQQQQPQQEQQQQPREEHTSTSF